MVMNREEQLMKAAVDLGVLAYLVLICVTALLNSGVTF